MQGGEIWQEAGASHGPDGGEILAQHMDDTGFVVNMSLLHPRQVSLKAVFSFPAFYRLFHLCDIGGQFDTFSISEPDVVVRLTFYQFNSFGLEGGVEVDESFAKEIGQQKQGRALIETMTTVAY